ncbi:MAG TPA: GAF domain-containing protein, partial [Spirochaetota bacterium]|nr:GAF domain-containing protein [Spirochaetota bacterium]
MGCIEPCYLGVPDHLPVIISRLFMLSVKHGNSPYSPYAYILFAGIILQTTGNVKTITQLCSTALNVLEHVKEQQISSKVFFVYGVGVNHWTRHIREDLPYLFKSYECALETGDITYASYAIHHYLINTFFSGDALGDVLEKYSKYYSAMKKLNLLNTVQSFEQMYQLIINLIDPNHTSNDISGEIFNEADIIPEWRSSKSLTILGHYTVSKMMLCNFYGDFRSTIQFAGDGHQYLDSMMGLYFVPEYWFHYAIAAELSSQNAGPMEKFILQRIAGKSAKKILNWSRHSPENYEHKYYIIQAVREGVRGKIAKSLLLFEKAIKSAHISRYTQYEALANELASSFSYNNKLYSIAETFSLRACAAYTRWGAKRKVELLREKHKELFGKSIQSSFGYNKASGHTESISDSTGIYSTIIDLSSVLKSAHSIAKEIQLAKLVESLMRIAVENAGGQKGVLLLKKGTSLFIEAEIFADNSNVTVLNSIPIGSYTDGKGLCPGLPASIINYISRTQQDIIIDNAVEDFRFSGDPYIEINTIRSILCTPIVYQGSLTGILYIENNIVSGAFAPERLTVMKMLSSQAAISIEIASIYAGLEALVKERTEIIEEQKHELEHQIDLAGKIQTALLPRHIPEIEQMTIAFRYKPMMGIGGDFLDIKYSEPDNSIGFFICDVSGHGVAAALVASMVKMSLSTWEMTLAQPRQTLF